MAQEMYNESQSTGAIIEETHDERDFLYGEIASGGVALPEEFVIESPLMYQNGIDSCVGSAVAGAKSVQEGKKVSPRFIWGMAKRIQNYEGWGTYISYALRQLVRYGAADYGLIDETVVGVNRDDYMRFDLSDDLVQSAENNKSLSYWRISTNDWGLAKQALFENKVPIITSMYWYDSYNKPVNGFLPLEKTGKKNGHAFLYSGWKIIDGEVVYVFRNSWQEKWGIKSYFYIRESDIGFFEMKGLYLINDIPVDTAKILANYQNQFVKSAVSEKVYVISGREKRHIKNELVFWMLSQSSLSNVNIVDDDSLTAIKDGDEYVIEDIDEQIVHAMTQMAKLYSVNSAYAQKLFSELLT